MEAIQTRILELTDGESVSVDENEAVVIIPRSKRNSLLGGVDPLFWDLEHSPAIRTAYIERELRKHVIAWRYGDMIMERVENGIVLYVATTQCRIFLPPSYRWQLQPVVYANEVDAYMYARRYSDNISKEDYDSIANKLIGEYNNNK